MYCYFPAALSQRKCFTLINKTIKKKYLHATRSLCHWHLSFVDKAELKVLGDNCKITHFQCPSPPLPFFLQYTIATSLYIHCVEAGITCDQLT